MPAEPAACLGGTEVIEPADPGVAALSARLCSALADAAGRARALFAWVRDEVSYDIAPVLERRADWRASATLARGSGFCQQKAVLLVSLARAAGIPAAIAFQHIRDHKLLEPRFARLLPDGIIPFHGLTMLHLDGGWLRVDPTLDRRLCAERGYRLVAFDGRSEALLPATDRDGRPHFELLGELGPFADLPPAVSQAAVDLEPVWTELRAQVRRKPAAL